MTRGPLPARVYWVRRILVLGTALALVVAIAHLLGNGSNASDGDTAAQTSAQTSARTTPSTTVDPGDDLSSSAKSGRGRGKHTKPGQGTTSSKAPTLAEPEGPCVGSDVVVAPKVTGAVAGRDVTVVLQLRTMQSPACTFAVSANTLTLNITSGKDAIWSSRDCPRAIPRSDVVVRNNVTAKVEVVWTQAKRSSERCILGTDWAMPGWYHATAAALAGEPADTQFELTTPIAGTITRTATPTNSPSSKPTNKPGGTSTNKPGGRSGAGASPSGSASGAVEPG